MDLSFYSGDTQLEQLASSVIVLTGTGRCGKTTVGNILGTCRGTEHIDDPWLLANLPTLAGRGVMPEALALQMFRTQAWHLLYNRILMRHVNFRPNDLSSIWKQKSPQEIISRITGLYSIKDIYKYAETTPTTLVLSLANTVPFYQFFWEAMPGCQIIHMLREGLDVAVEVTEKHWFSDDELRRPFHPDPYRPYVRHADAATCYLPYWVEEGAEERYVNSSEFGRGLQYWRRLMEMSGLADPSHDSLHDMRTVRMSDVLDRPSETIDALITSLGLEKTELTDPLVANVRRPEGEHEPIEVSSGVEREELQAMNVLYAGLGLSTERISQLLAASPQKATVVDR